MNTQDIIAKWESKKILKATPELADSLLKEFYQDFPEAYYAWGDGETEGHDVEIENPDGSTTVIVFYLLPDSNRASYQKILYDKDNNLEGVKLERCLLK